MNSLQSFILCFVYGAFLVLGALTFMHLEYEVNENRQVKELREWTKLKELALNEESPEDELLALAMWLPKNCSTVPDPILKTLMEPGSQVDTVMEIEKICPHIRVEDVTISVAYPWSFIDALYFSMTVSTTIGYGHISPSGNAGKIVCIIYALVGIPLTGILLAWTSEFFGEKLFQLFKSKLDSEKQQSKKVIAAATVLYVAVGFLVFVFLPAIVFMTMENWSYLEAVYYCFITLTTIGFGDFVTGNGSQGGHLYVYQVGVIVWIMIGLGYWVMVANFITKALRSKKLQSSVLRSAEEMKKIMQQMGIKNNDPRFLRQHSKATVNFMLQLSNIIAVQGGTGMDMRDGDAENPESPTSNGAASPTSSSAPYSPVSSPLGIPGISALFGPAINRTNPLAQLIGPLGLAKYVMSPRAKPCDAERERKQDAAKETEESARTEDNNMERPQVFVYTISGNSNDRTEMRGQDNAAYVHEISAESQINLKMEEEPV
ncbi:LOW QUALITY PROTEIN: open rectifier potassium channel protein 1-like [Palaemon carinicauda]|uniref:LOW QUALITY PROTEIN: open rectifier potassium channel protein 1-like n=1 Tax=Palaemon carinicauda TaxID=392227 RepID=UPI0035B578E1